jgi:RNA polymerase sigma-70 factor (ECF subfamily)
MADSELFQAHVPLLFSIAYRMLGSASDAEDVVQDAWLRLNGVDAREIRSPKALATTIVTRLCLDRLKSARASREQYTGPWLPEPVLTGGGETPDVLAQRSESVTLAFLLLLDTLSPEERAVFLLKEVFDYDHSEIAETLGTTSANSRQLLHRAKEKIAAADKNRTAAMAGAVAVSGEPRQAPSRERRELAERFAALFAAGDADRLASLLSEDVTFVSDGGGKVPAAGRPLVGRDLVIKFLVGIQRGAKALGLTAQASFAPVEVNGEPAMVLRVAGRLDSVYVFSTGGNAISAIRVIRNPDKLHYIERQLASIM